MGQKVGRRKHPASNPSSRELAGGEDAGFQGRPSEPRDMVGQKSQALGEFSLGPGQKWVWDPSDMGLPGINRPPVPSPGLLPAGSRMSVSSLLLCLNTVCGMCEGGQIRQWQPGSLGCLTQPCFSLTRSSSSCLFHQALGLTHPLASSFSHEGSGASRLQMLHPADCARTPFSFPQAEPERG